MNFTNEFFYKKRKLAGSSRPGGHASSVRGSGMIFDRLVSLVNNPDPRRLDIRASLNDPFEQWWVREYRQKAAIPVIAVIDLSKSLSFRGEYDNSVFISDFLKSLSRSTYLMGDRLGLLGFDTEVRADWNFPATQKRVLSENLIDKLFENLKFNQGHKGIKDLYPFLPKESGLVFFLSDFHFSLNLFDEFLLSSSNHEIVPIIIQDKAEMFGWPDRGVSLLSDSETGKKRLVWINQEWINKVKESYENRNNKIIEICAKHGISPLFMSGNFSSKTISSHFLTGSMS